MALPLWRHVVGYEERDPTTMGKLRCGYPRFYVHPVVAEFMSEARRQLASPGEIAYVFPSRATAALCSDYVRDGTGLELRLDRFGADGLHAVIGPGEAEAACREFWQHTGLIVSSRRARSALRGKDGGKDSGAEVDAILRGRIATWYGAAPDDVYLYPSGMAAIYAATDLAARLNPGARRAQLEFPYLDTMKVHERFSTGATLYADGDAADLVDRLRRDGPVGLVTTEIPSNPLLRTVSLKDVSPLLREQGAVLIVDDTIATPVNVDVTPWADIVTTSLTKFFCGAGDVIAGAAVLNPRSPHYAALSRLFRTQHENLLWHEDAEALELRSRDFAARVRQINGTAEILAEYLRSHPAIGHVWYPKFDRGGGYEPIRRPGGGYGGLISMLTEDPERRAAPFYDALRVNKGPSLGTDFTLACPYTMIAHYRELDWAENFGVSRWLIRISVGLEDADDLCARFERALSATQIAG